MSITRMPPELVLRVADNLKPEDVVNLAQASKKLAYIVKFTGLCKRVLTAHAAHSPEAIRAQEDGDYARALRTLVKRRNAVRMAEPFHVAFIAVGSWFVYTNGVLCYNMEGGLLRVLDIKNSADHELVIDVFRMLRENGYRLPSFTGHKLMPLYYGHGVLACELRLEESPHMAYLIAMRPYSGKVLFVDEQPLDDRTIVTTSQKYLFLCHPVAEPHPTFWGLRKFNLETLKWVHEVPRFVSVAKRSGNVVACTVYGNHVYVVSSRDPLIHINRLLQGGRHARLYYQAARLPLEPQHKHPLEVEATLSSWVQPYTGAMCKEEWDFLSLETDEKTGNLGAIQLRREFPDSGPSTMRKCIRRPMAFPGDSTDPPELTTVLTATTHSFPLGNGHLGTHVAVEPWNNGEGPHVLYSVNAGIEGSEYHGFGHAGPRLPPKTTVHYGDSSSTLPAYSASQCFIRSYFSSTNSFVDLVNDTLRNNGKEQSLRLRVMTEIPGGGNETVFWPPKNDPDNPDARLQELKRIMNRPGYDGAVEWGVDGSSFVYATRSHKNPLKRSIVYVGFDPTVKIHHLKSFNKAGRSKPEASSHSGSNENVSSRSSAQENINAASRDQKRKPSFPSLGVSWAWLEEPLYFQSRGNNGFDFFA